MGDQFPSNPGPRPVAAVYRDGDACPVCQQAVDYVQYDPARPVGDEYTLKGDRGAVLFPCGHRTERVLAPGNRKVR